MPCGPPSNPDVFFMSHSVNCVMPAWARRIGQCDASERREDLECRYAVVTHGSLPRLGCSVLRQFHLLQRCAHPAVFGAVGDPTAP